LSLVDLIRFAGSRELESLRPASESRSTASYPALHRLERHKFLKSLWREADGRRRRYYKLTDAGRAELASRKQSWYRFAAGIDGVLGSNRAGWAETT